MNAIAPSYADQMARYGFVAANHEKPEWFPVSVGELYDAKGNVIGGYKRVGRDDTGDTLAVHSDKYRLISYEESFAEFDRQLEASDLDTTDMMICTDMAKNGARCFRQYILPAYQIEVRGGDKTALRIVMFNSYDGSKPFSGMAGGYRFVCANEAVIGDDIIKVNVRHTGNKPIELVFETMLKAIDRFLADADRQRAWAGRKIEAARVIDFVKPLPLISERLEDHFTTRFVGQEDQTLYGLYNVLTAWATHGDDGKLPVHTRMERQQRIAVAAKAWDKIAA